MELVKIKRSLEFKKMNKLIKIKRGKQQLSLNNEKFYYSLDFANTDGILHYFLEILDKDQVIYFDHTNSKETFVDLFGFDNQNYPVLIFDSDILIDGSLKIDST